MKVTVRDVQRPDGDDICDWPAQPQLGLPYPGSEIILPREAYWPKDKRGFVSRYRWDLSTSTVHMLVAFD